MAEHSNGQVPGWFQEVQALLDDGYAGQIVLHCDGRGNVVKYETNQTHTPRRGMVDLTESGPR